MSGYGSITIPGQPSPPYCWLAFYNDWSEFRVFPTEVEALRWAVERSLVRVVPLRWGQDPREAVAS